MQQFQYMLAPIEDMTGGAFRAICFKYGADVTFTEMARIESLGKKNKCTWSRLTLLDDTPTVMQLLGANEFYLKKFLTMFKPSHGFSGFNLNLGCPNPRVVKVGQGCAMVRRISKTKKLVDIIKKNDSPVSIKMRLGINRRDEMHKSYLNLIKAVDADFFIVHARYGSDTYDNAADFSVYADCVATGKKIIANGDITTESQVKFLKEVGVSGAMIGRAAIAEPCIFNRLKGINSPSIEVIKKEYLALSQKYGEAFKYQKNVMKRIGEGFGKSVEE